MPEILFTGTEPNALNPYVANVVEAIQQTDKAWTPRIRPDLLQDIPPTGDAVLHIQWPEALVPRWKTPGRNELRDLIRKLRSWADRLPLVCTVHNVQPHRAAHPRDLRLRDAVWSMADGFVHLGKASISLVGHPNALHRIIPHPIPAPTEMKSSASSTYQHANYVAEWPAVLVFGQIRSLGEIRRLEAIYADFNEQINLLIPQFYRGIEAVPDRWQRFLLKRRAARGTFERAGWCTGDSVLPSDEISRYLYAADVVLVNRREGLNSGNVYLGFNFGRVVVGPAIGNIGPTLEAYQNPTYPPTDTAAMCRAIRAGLALAGTDRGALNRLRMAHENSAALIGRTHTELYRQILNRR